MQQELVVAKNLAQLCAQVGGRVYYVGGYVRDRLLQKPGKDTDLEVHGLTAQQLEGLLDCLGPWRTVGAGFCVYNLSHCSLDISLAAPGVTLREAAARRDLTINAMMEDVLTGEIVDFFGGQADLTRGQIRHMEDRSFAEDPLRVLRAAQFAARFSFSVAPETVLLCSKLSLDGLPRERIDGELQKALLRSPRPSVFFETLRQMGQLSVWFPELEALIGVEQNPVHHAEGDVWTHTMLVIDAAAQFREQVSRPYGFMLAAVTHDFGKAVTTEAVNGVIHAYGHENAGVPLVKKFMGRLTRETALVRYVCNLTELHMKPNIAAAAGSSVKATNRMFDEAMDAEALIRLAEADSIGKEPPVDFAANDRFLRSRLAVYEEYMSRPYVTGQDLLQAGLTPDKRFSELLAFAHKLRLSGVDYDSALKQTLAMARKHSVPVNLKK